MIGAFHAKRSFNVGEFSTINKLRCSYATFLTKAVQKGLLHKTVDRNLVHHKKLEGFSLRSFHWRVYHVESGASTQRIQLQLHCKTH